MYAATRDAMLKHTGLADPWAALKTLGVQAVELGVNRDLKCEQFPGAAGGLPCDLRSAPSLRALRERCKSDGVRVCALLMANDFSNADFEAEVLWGVDAVRAAAELGAGAVRVDFVPRQPGADLEAFTRRCVEGARKILAATEGSGVALAVENHGRVSNRPEFLDRIFADVGSPRMGLTLDTGNFYWFGHPLESVYGIMERYAGRVRHTHVKNIAYPPETRAQTREIGWRYGDFCCPLEKGDLDHARVARILKAGGYDGALALEDESIGKAPEAERLEVLRRDIAHLQACAR